MAGGRPICDWCHSTVRPLAPIPAQEQETDDDKLLGAIRQAVQGRRLHRDVSIGLALAIGVAAGTAGAAGAVAPEAVTSGRCRNTMRVRPAAVAVPMVAVIGLGWG